MTLKSTKIFLDFTTAGAQTLKARAPQPTAGSQTLRVWAFGPELKLLGAAQNLTNPTVGA